MAFNKITSSKLYKLIESNSEGMIFSLKLRRYAAYVLKFLIDDVNWQKIQYKKIFNKELHLEEPSTFAEKVLYLKLFYRNPMQHICVDKQYVYEYVRNLGYERILIPIIGIYNSTAEIDFDRLPMRFFMKSTQGSGWNKLVDKSDSSFSKKYICKFFDELLRRDYYKVGREWAYKGVHPRIMIVEDIRNNKLDEITDYKFYCFGGELKYYMVSYGEYDYHVRNHKFDANNKSIDYLFKKDSVLNANDIKLPDNIEEMKTIAQKLSGDFPHVRVDLYNIDGQIYFGELTFYSSGGFIKVYNHEMDKEIGSWIPLEKYKDDMLFSKKTKKYAVALNKSENNLN